ncbi:MAG: hypothetical protein ACHQ1D_07325, partial [Nitrososphaerales archaeon]
SLASPLKKISTDEKKIITPSKIICCKDDTSTSSDSASTSLASPLKKISTKPTQHDEAVETEKSSHETSEEVSDDQNLSDLIQTNLGKLLNVNSNEMEDNNKDAKDINDNNNDNNKDAKDINDNNNDNNKDAKDINDNTNDRLNELRTIVSAVLS